MASKETDNRYITTLGIERTSESTQEFQDDDRSKIARIGSAIGEKIGNIQERFNKIKEKRKGDEWSNKVDLVSLELKQDQNINGETVVTPSVEVESAVKSGEVQLPAGEAPAVARELENGVDAESGYAKLEATRAEAIKELAILAQEVGELDEDEKVQSGILALVKKLGVEMYGNNLSKSISSNEGSKKEETEVGASDANLIEFIKENPSLQSEKYAALHARFSTGEESQIDTLVVLGVVEKELGNLGEDRAGERSKLENLKKQAELKSAMFNERPMSRVIGNAMRSYVEIANPNNPKLAQTMSRLERSEETREDIDVLGDAVEAFEVYMTSEGLASPKFLEHMRVLKGEILFHKQNLDSPHSAGLVKFKQELARRASNAN